MTAENLQCAFREYVNMTEKKVKETFFSPNEGNINDEVCLRLF